MNGRSPGFIRNYQEWNIYRMASDSATAIFDCSRVDPEKEIP